MVRVSHAAFGRERIWRGRPPRSVREFARLFAPRPGSFLLLCVLFLGISPLHADGLDGFSLDRLELGAGAGFMGNSIVPGYRVSNRFGIRVPFSNKQFVTETTDEWGKQVAFTYQGIKFQTDLPIQHQSIPVTGDAGGMGIVVDYYADAKISDRHQQRWSFGLFRPNYSLGGSGEINDAIYLERGPGQGGEWVDAKSISSRMWIDNLTPYFGLGYNYGDEEGLGLGLDVGFLFAVKYEGEISGVASDPADQERLDAGLDREMSGKLNYLENFPLLPYISLSAVYRY